MLLKNLLSLRRLNPQTLIYLVTKDKLFENKFSLDISANTKYGLKTLASGEEFFADTTYNALPDNTIPFVVLDYDLKSHEHQEARNGLQILKEMRDHDINWDVIMMSSPQDKKVMNKALHDGAAAFVFKNENAVIRICNNIMILMNQRKMIAEKFYTKVAVVIFLLLLTMFSVVAYIIYSNQLY